MDYTGTTAEIKRKSNITSYKSTLTVSSDISIEGNLNKVVASKPCSINLVGTMNTIYGKGDISVQGRWNVASTTEGNTIHFKQEDGTAQSIDIDTVNAGKPYCLVQDQDTPPQVYEVYRRRRVPYIIKDKKAIEIGGQQLNECLIKGPISKAWRYGIIDPNNNVLMCEDHDYLVKLAECKAQYKWLQEDELKQAIYSHIKETSRVTLYEYILATNACISGIKKWIEKEPITLFRQLMPSLIEGKSIPLQEVLPQLNRMKHKVEVQYKDQSLHTFLLGIGALQTQ